MSSGYLRTCEKRKAWIIGSRRYSIDVCCLPESQIKGLDINIRVRQHKLIGLKETVNIEMVLPSMSNGRIRIQTFDEHYTHWRMTLKELPIKFHYSP